MTHQHFVNRIAASSALCLIILAGCGSSGPLSCMGKIMGQSCSARSVGSANGKATSPGSYDGITILPDQLVLTNLREGFLELNTLPGKWVIHQNQMIFTAKTASEGIELWQSDGTVPGTTLIMDLESGSNSSQPDDMTMLGNQTFLTAQVTTLGREPWMTDGTTSGTKLLKDIYPNFSSIDSLGAFATTCGDMVFFNASNSQANQGHELWKTAGTPETTEMIKDIYPGPNHSNPSELTCLNQKVIFNARMDNQSGTIYGRELYISDGTASGTTLLKDLATGTYAESNPQEFTVAGAKAFFSAATSETGRELWITDGTPDGTRLLKDINPGSAGSQPSHFIVKGDLVLFSATDGTHGYEYWISNGTPEGTRLLGDFCPGSCSSTGAIVSAVLRDEFVFATLDSENTKTLWKTDKAGTNAQQIMSFGKTPSNTPVSITRLAAWNGYGYFLTNATSTSGISQLWVTDGSADGTRVLSTIQSRLPDARVINSIHFAEQNIFITSGLNGQITLSKLSASP